MTTLRSRNRRRVTIAAAALPSALLFASRAADNTLRFGTTPVFLDDQIALLGRWQLYLEGALLRPVQFVQRGSYREIMDLLLADRIDVAWVCGFPYVVHQARLSLVVVPTY